MRARFRKIRSPAASLREGGFSATADTRYCREPDVRQGPLSLTPLVQQITGAVSALGLAHYWQHLLDTGRFRSLTEIAAAEGMDLGQVSRIARMAQLAPRQA